MFRIILLLLILSLGTMSMYPVTAEETSVPFPFLKNPFLPNVDVLIDVGHGGIDSGTTYENIYEKDINLEMAKLTYKKLREKGLRVLVNRMDDYALSDENRWLRDRSRHLKDLAQRSHLANEIHPKAVISLHVNWSGSSKKRGPLVLYQKTEPSKQLAICLQQSLNTAYGTTSEALLGKPYYLLNHVRVPAVIVEMGYISNALDREQMMKPQKQEQLAESITSGVIAYLKKQ